jgi:hypothetical protein
MSGIERRREMKRGRLSRWFCLSAVCFSFTAKADTASVSQNVSLSLLPTIKITAVPTTVTLLPMAAAFSGYSGSLPISFKVRTSNVGTASITLSASSEFVPATGPSIANGDLVFSCAAASFGTACSGSSVVSILNQASLVSIPANACTGGGGSCSPTAPNSVTITLTLKDLPRFATSSYSSNLTFTASAL